VRLPNIFLCYEPLIAEETAKKQLSKADRWKVRAAGAASATKSVAAAQVVTGGGGRGGGYGLLPSVSEAPCVKNGFVTFGSFNSTTKVWLVVW
jgi:hypothetical protein